MGMPDRVQHQKIDPDKRIGNYRVIKLLGKGGFAAVYLCQHQYIGTLAAVKVLRAGMDEMEKTSFFAEARIAASLVHPRIIRVLEFGEENRRPYLVMDYAPNGTIRQLCPQGTRVTPRAVVKYVEQIAGALQYVHKRGLVHRDIKPENLLLGANNQLLLSDFGISINAHRTASGAEMIAGTAAYMAPELIEGEACFASDQYALGVVVYEWLCGTWPFQGSSEEIMSQHLYDFPPRLREHVPTIPAAVEEVVLKALAKNPRDRFGSVLEFTAALKAAFGYRTIVPKAQMRDSAKRPESQQKQNIWKEISALFAFDLFAGSAVGIALYELRVAPQILWMLLSLSLVLFALGGALVMRNRVLFLLACGLTIMVTLLGIISHSFALFVALYGILLILGLMAAFVKSVQFQISADTQDDQKNRFYHYSLQKVHSFCYYAIGKSLSTFGFNSKALWIYEKAILLEYRQTQLYINKGDVFFNLKRYQEALAAYDEAIRLTPDSSKAYRKRGKTFEQLAQQSYDGFKQLAKESYKKAKEFRIEETN